MSKWFRKKIVGRRLRRLHKDKDTLIWLITNLREELEKMKVPPDIADTQLITEWLRRIQAFNSESIDEYEAKLKDILAETERLISEELAKL